MQTSSWQAGGMGSGRATGQGVAARISDCPVHLGRGFPFYSFNLFAPAGLTDCPSGILVSDVAQHFSPTPACVAFLLKPAGRDGCMDAQIGATDIEWAARAGGRHGSPRALQHWTCHSNVTTQPQPQGARRHLAQAGGSVELGQRLVSRRTAEKEPSQHAGYDKHTLPLCSSHP